MVKIFTMGINSAYHENSAAIALNGEIIAAVEEERFNRKKHGKGCYINNPDELPYESINYCLKYAGIAMKDISTFGFSFSPINRLVRNVGLDEKVIEGDWGSIDGERLFYQKAMLIPTILEEKYKTKIYEKWNWLTHHVAHAASAYYASPFNDAAILTVDGIGEFNSILLGHGKKHVMHIIEETGSYPNSVGFIWTKASRFLDILQDGLGEYGAGKLMALASYGNPDKFYKKFRSFIDYDDLGNFKIDTKIFEFRAEGHQEYEKLFGFKARKEGEDVTQDHIDFCAGVQRINSEIVLGLANRLYKETKTTNLTMAGGVALNCTTNSVILQKSKFKNIYVQPGANDMGGAIGAALYVYHHILGQTDKKNMETPYLGPSYSNKDILSVIKKTQGIKYKKVKDIEKETAKLIADGAVIGWFQGRLEFGPRALCGRSIIADPRIKKNFEKVSLDIKGREWYRPLAPVVMDEYTDDWFARPKSGAEGDKWMLFSYKIHPKKRKLIPAVCHYDNTGRIQRITKESNPKFHKLLAEFNKLTGVPILINTSFNIKEPIICSPEHAINTFLKSGYDGIDFLVLGDYIVTRKEKEWLIREKTLLI